ncbi:hypothetical protein [Helicobacter fennelliae]|uniref:DUF904 domain-containing protein n=2 Tax=Helicobacter fennelliae TaxID=215 RepID=T1DWH8_9HELI|nr:hypothetical protein [Helicobacter fennelliae]GAD19412.1 hypothetical protein HFN_0543 [Helicobacter fennelliae MRY12-0050]SQB99221.1 Uncharacterised protein [Helicobacter fennelliae]STP08448.1 Uncharacterised protein [Helicobacter fennelliae]STQ84864.1 Uncharacterised protein [Helicobacter fennelliae]
MSLIQDLEEKLDSILQNYHKQAQEIESLKLQITSLQASSKQKDLQISALYEELANKDKALESFYNKISHALEKQNLETQN